MENKSKKVGIIVGRFHIDILHSGHRVLIETVLNKHERVIIFLGVAPVFSRKNTLDYPCRELMFKSLYPKSEIYPLKDVGDDKLWVKILDKEIEKLCGDDQAVVYGGSKESCVPKYREFNGKYESDIVEYYPMNATDFREQIAKQPIDSVDFRKGVIYSIYNQKYPTAFRTCDLMVTRVVDGKIELLLGQKHNETHENVWRLIGGFVDPTDKTGREAAARELKEESNLVVDPSRIKIIDEVKIEDWRYRGTEDGIMTTIYNIMVSEEESEKAVGGDDIAKVKWFSIEEAEQVIRPLHKICLEIFKKSDTFLLIEHKINQKILQ